MLNGWHVRWVCCLCKNWDVFSFQELCTDPCNMRPGIIMLQHEMMVVDEWHNNGPQDLVTVSLCIQNAINKMHPCSLSITYACSYPNPTTTMGHSIHNIDISKPLTHTTPYTLSAICPVQWKPGFIREENTSPKCQTDYIYIYIYIYIYEELICKTDPKPTMWKKKWSVTIVIYSEPFFSFVCTYIQLLMQYV